MAIIVTLKVIFFIWVILSQILPFQAGIPQSLPEHRSFCRGGGTLCPFSSRESRKLSRTQDAPESPGPQSIQKMGNTLQTTLLQKHRF